MRCRPAGPRPTRRSSPSTRRARRAAARRCSRSPGSWRPGSAGGAGATATGRLDVRRTMRRSLQTGGIPIDPALRRRHPHRPDVVVLCDVSGSVAEFAQFTFTLVHALHDVLGRGAQLRLRRRRRRDDRVFDEADHEVPVQRMLERRGVVGLDGHSDYGAAFGQFADEYLDDAVGRRTTVIVTGDGRSNFRDPGRRRSARIADRARRVVLARSRTGSRLGRRRLGDGRLPHLVRRRVRGVDRPLPRRRHRRARLSTAPVLRRVSSR